MYGDLWMAGACSLRLRLPCMLLLVRALSLARLYRLGSACTQYISQCRAASEHTTNLLQNTVYGTLGDDGNAHKYTRRLLACLYLHWTAQVIDGLLFRWRAP